MYNHKEESFPIFFMYNYEEESPPSSSCLIAKKRALSLLCDKGYNAYAPIPFLQSSSPEVEAISCLQEIFLYEKETCSKGATSARAASERT